MLLANKTAVITGANRGMGLAILRNFARHGCRVYAACRSPDDGFLAEVSRLSAEHGVEVRTLELDLASDDSIKQALRNLHREAGSIDVLVNNAGIASGALAQMTSMADLRRIFDVNFFAQVQLVQGAARLMKGTSGSVIFLSSVAAHRPDPGTLAYGCSKAALERAMRSLASELGERNIRVNAIAPGVTRTRMADQMHAEAREKLITGGALKRLAEPEEIANVALFLASDLSSFVTGQTIHADGGVF